jgi:hypothetical protein
MESRNAGHEGHLLTSMHREEFNAALQVFICL